MSGAVMLLMAAAVGITFGWTPDGGNGVKYIIQIPPEKVEQVARSGEISSHIPTEIRGHVSEVVIRVGHGNLPRITPSHLAAGCSITAPNPSVIAAADHIPVPIPAMDDPAALRPIGGTAPIANSMMKPSPQSGGMNLPGFTRPAAPSTASTGPSTNFGQAASETANQVANELRNTADASRQQVQQNINATTQRFGEAANTQMQSAADQVRDSAAQLFAPRPSTSAPDDPRARLSQNSGSEADRPATDAATPPAFATSRANASTPAATPPPSGYERAAPNQATESRSASNSTRDDDWYDLRNGSPRRPSTDPIDRTAGNTGSSDGFSGSNFGRLPGGLQTEPAPRNTDAPRNSDAGTRSQYAGATSSEQPRRDNNATTELDYDPNLSPAQASQLPKNGYSFDAQNHPVDRAGYRLDQYGRRVDLQGRLLTAVDSMANNNDERRNSQDNNTASNPAGPYPDRTDTRIPPGYNTDPQRPHSSAGSGNPYPNSGYPGNNSYAGNTSQLVQPPLAPQPTPPQQQPQSPQGQQPQAQQPQGQQPPSGTQYGNYNQVPYAPLPVPSPASPAGMPGYNPYPHSQYAGAAAPSGGSRVSEDAPRSPADTAGRGKRFEDLDSALSGDLREPVRSAEQVAAQPIFNALLLLSVVANVYLLFWLKNLRLQFRDMVASNRAANSGTSLATGV